MAFPTMPSSSVSVHLFLLKNDELSGGKVMLLHSSSRHKLAVTGTSISPRQEFATTHMAAQKDTASKTLFLFGKMLELGFEHDEVMLGFLVSERELREQQKRLINAMNG